MADDDIILNLVLEAGGAGRPGYGIDGVVTHQAPWPGPERVNYVRSLTDVTTLGYADDSPEFLSVQAILFQEPHPEQVAILKSTIPVVQQYTIAVQNAARNLFAYAVDVKGEGFDPFTASFTSSAASSFAEVHAGLATQLNLTPGRTFTAGLAAQVIADTVFTATNATEIFTAAAHGFQTGDGPVQVSNAGGALPAGLVAATDYWIIVVDANTYKLATSLANALAGTNLLITTDGTGVQTLSDTPSTKRPSSGFTVTAFSTPARTFTADNATEIFTAAAHGYQTGDGPIRVTTTGALPAGLLVDTDYWIIRVTDNTFKLATSSVLALAGTNLLITTDGTGVQTIAAVTGNAKWFSLSIRNAAALFIAQTHVVSGLSADLVDILNEDSAWYTLQLLYPSSSYVLQAASFAEANGRTLAVSISDNKSIKTVLAGATDVGAALFNLGYKRTMWMYHPDPSQFLDAAWMGRFLQGEPGQINPKWKPLTGVTPVSLTTQDKINLEARRGNSYKTSRGNRRRFTFEGMVPSLVNKFFDITRNLDWTSDNVVDDQIDMFVAAENIPFTREGVQAVEGTLRGTMGKAIRQGVASANPAPTVTPPIFALITTADKSDKVLQTMKFSFTLAGGINKVRINGTLTF